MSYTIDKFGAGDNDSNGDYPLTKNQAKVLLKKLTDQKIFYELEPIEVLDVFVDLEDDFPFTDENDNPDVNRIGTIRGRYVVSEHDQQVEDGYFFPLDQNVIQYPVVGEVVIGFEFNDNRYYFSKLPAELNLPPRSVDFNISNTSGLGNNFNTLNQNTPLDQYRSGRYFTPDKDVTRLTPREGDTIISGRFGNTIRLGHNKIEKSPNIKLVAGGFKNNDEPYFENLQNDNSSIYITTNEKVEYSKPTSDFKKLLNIDYDKPQLVFDSDRIVLNSKKDDIAIFSENDVHIKGKRVNIENNEGVNITAKTITNDISNKGKIINKTKQGKTTNFPELDMMGFVKQITGIQRFLQAMTLGVPKLSNPVTLPSGIKDIVKGLDGAKNFIDATINLEFLNKQIFETKTPDEIRNALPIPKSISGVIDDITNVTEEQLKKLKELSDQNSSKLEAALQLKSAIDSKNPTGVLSALDSVSNLENVPGIELIREAVEISDSVEEFENFVDNGGTETFLNALSEYESFGSDVQQVETFTKILNIS